MKVYLLSAAGAIFLSVIISLLIPEGKLNKTITFILRLVCIAVLIQPITGLFKIKITDTQADMVDYTYVSEVYSRHQSEQLEELLYKEFSERVECAVEVAKKDDKFEVISAEVRLKENNKKLIEEIYAYLSELGYINITVYAQGT